MKLSLPKPFWLLVGVLASCSGQDSATSGTTAKPDSLANVQTGPEKELRKTNPIESAPSATSPLLVELSILKNVNILIPETFRIMDDKMVALKYPSKLHAVFLVYTNDDATVNIAFEHTPNKATIQELPAIKQVLEQQFMQPGIDLRKSEIRNINGRDFIIIEMITPAADTEIYNLMFVTSSEGRLLICTVNCTMDKFTHWQPLARQILHSVKVSA